MKEVLGVLVIVIGIKVAINGAIIAPYRASRYGDIAIVQNVATPYTLHFQTRDIALNL